MSATSTTGESILPMDLTFTNIIVHTLLANPLANDMRSSGQCAAVAQLPPARIQWLQDSHSYLEQLSSSNLVRIFQEHNALVCGRAGFDSALCIKLGQDRTSGARALK